ITCPIQPHTHSSPAQSTHTHSSPAQFKHSTPIHTHTHTHHYTLQTQHTNTHTHHYTGVLCLECVVVLVCVYWCAVFGECSGVSVCVCVCVCECVCVRKRGLFLKEIRTAY